MRFFLFSILVLLASCAQSPSVDTSHTTQSFPALSFDLSSHGLLLSENKLTFETTCGPTTGASVCSYERFFRDYHPGEQEHFIIPPGRSIAFSWINGTHIDDESSYYYGAGILLLPPKAVRVDESLNQTINGFDCIQWHGGVSASTYSRGVCANSEYTILVHLSGYYGQSTGEKTMNELFLQTTAQLN